jgi:hypothetical protein
MTDETNSRPTYVVGNDSNPAHIRAAVEGLRKMAKMGEKARQALEALERDGHFDQLVHWVDGEDKSYKTIKCNRFPRFVEVSAADMPILDSLWLAFGPVVKTQYGGHGCVEYTLSLRGDRFYQKKDRSLVLQPIPDRIRVGTLRVSKKKISYLSYGSKAAYPVTEKKATVEATVSRISKCDALVPLSEMCSNFLVVTGEGLLNQRARDMRAGSCRWMTDGGHAQRMLEDAVRTLWIEGVHES